MVFQRNPTDIYVGDISKVNCNITGPVCFTQKARHYFHTNMLATMHVTEGTNYWHQCTKSDQPQFGEAIITT